MSESLQEVEAELHDAAERARRLVETTDGRLFTVRPAPGSWSASECIAHLNLTTASFLPILREALDSGRTRGLTASRIPKMDLLGRILRWFLEPPIRTRVQTTAPFVPKAIRAKAETLGEFNALQRELIDLVHAAQGLDVSKLRVVSAFDKRVKYNVYSAFRIIAAHERRHLWQAEQAIASLQQSWSA